MKNERICPVCGRGKAAFFLKARDTERMVSGPYCYYQCGHCQLVFLSPIPSEKELKRFYQREYFKGSKILEVLQRERRKKVENLIAKGRILDFGCGEGVFLSLMKRHDWSAFGFDAAVEAGKMAHEKYGLKMINPPLTERTFPPRSFEVITLWHTLEHIAKPLPELRTLRSFLADNGYLFISVPNIASLEAKISRDKWFHLDPPRHCCHYGPGSLDFLLKKAGFTIIKTDYFSIEYNFSSFWQTILNCLGSAPNFFYHQLKRQPIKTTTTAEYCYSYFISVIGGIVILFPAVLLTIILSFSKQSGSLTVVAKKAKNI